MAGVQKMEAVRIDLLKPYDRNAKKHPKSQLDIIAKSIKELGFLSPCLIDSEYHLIAGHGRVEAAKQIGMESVPCVFIEGLTEAQRRAYIIADNRLTELGEWDEDLVQEELRDLQEMDFDITITGFEAPDPDLDSIRDEDYIVDDIGEDQKETRSRKGDLWELGNHRLMVGDSTDTMDVLALMGGDKADLLVTDPPYNVSLGQKSGHVMRPSEAKRLHRRTDGLVIENDSMNDEDFAEFLKSAVSNAMMVMRDGAAYYIWHAGTNSRVFINVVEDVGLTIRQILIWAKSTFAFGRQDYQWKHEPCLYGWKDGAAHYFVDRRNETTVIENPPPDIDKLSKEEMADLLRQIYDEEITPTTVLHEKKPMASELHPTMKPVPLFARLIRNSSKQGDIVLDLFCGSGTTVVACEELGRRCFAMELDPRYADVIIDRWERKTGQTAKRIRK